MSVDVNAAVDDNVEQVLFDNANNLYLVGNTLATPQQISVVKTSTTGVLDTGFAGGGMASFVMAPASANAGVYDAAVDSANNIVVAGFGEVSATNANMIGRIKTDGTLDTSFNSVGYFESTPCASVAQLESVILLNNSSLVVAGQLLY